MLAIMFGLLVSGLVWLVLFNLWDLIIDELNDTYKKVVNSVFILVSGLLPISIIAMFISANVTSYEKSIALINVEREVIIDSFYNESLGGIEPSNLVEQINEINRKIIELQFDKKQWYGFLIPDEVNDLELIDFK